MIGLLDDLIGIVGKAVVDKDEEIRRGTPYSVLLWPGMKCSRNTAFSRVCHPLGLSPLMAARTSLSMRMVTCSFVAPAGRPRRFGTATPSSPSASAAGRKVFTSASVSGAVASSIV